VHTGDVRVDVQAALAMLSPIWNYRALLDTSDGEAREQLARASVMACPTSLSQPAASVSRPSRSSASTSARRSSSAFMTRWQGDPDPSHVKAVDAYFVSAAEHGMNASTFTARVIASTGRRRGRDVGRDRRHERPLHGGAPARVLPVIAESRRPATPRRSSATSSTATTG